jgi:hypothetical protein
MSSRKRSAKAPPPPAAPPSIIEALDDPELFGGMGFDAPSWEPWRAFLEALWGLPMSEGHLALYRHHTARTEPPTRPQRYAELVCGRRGGKSRVLALIACYMACVLDHKPYLSPGEKAVVGIIARIGSRLGLSCRISRASYVKYRYSLIWLSRSRRNRSP